MLVRHFPLWRIVPGSIILEAFAQLGSLLLESGAGFTRKALPAWIERARFRRPVDGPELVMYRLHRLQGDATGAVLEAEARQADEVRVTARIGFVLAPMALFFGPGQLLEYRSWVNARLTASARAQLDASAVRGDR
jgi:3-hydroxymyristoyl/3-hydroxydecanoyl-(acyl carrier protein) dehydratase